MHSVKRVKSTAEQAARRRRIEAGQIKEYRALYSQYLESRKAERYDVAAFDLTTKVLALNPESYSVWNYRREIFDKAMLVGTDDEETQKQLNVELRFIEDRLREFPKVYWIWNHRRWCLERGKNPDWARELGLVTKMLQLDARNYHGWHYRRYVVGNIEKATGKPMTEAEFNFTTTKINNNFSNFSAWHSRAKLIPPYLESKSRQERADFLNSELEYITRALYTDPDDQSGWLYHQWLVSTDVILPDMTVEEKVTMIDAELASIEELYDLEPNGKWCVHSLVFLNQEKFKATNTPLDDKTLASLRSMLSKLAVIDPMHKNRYVYLRENLTAA